MSKKVTTIPATANRRGSPLHPQVQKRKVSAYARVSTDQEEQLTSYEAQPLSLSGEPPPEPSKRGP